MLGLPSLASNHKPERKFLYIFNDGGWDPFCTFVPHFGVSGVEMEEGAEPSLYGNIPVVEHVSRPSFGHFMGQYGDRLCVINGMELRSVTHQRCTQLLMTGKSSNNVDDWPSIIAAEAKYPYPTPHLVLRGPAYSNTYSSFVVRAGSSGQLTQLLDSSSVFTQYPPLPDQESLETQYIQQQLGRINRKGRSEELRNGYLRALEQLDQISEDFSSVNLEGVNTGCIRNIVEDANNAFILFSKEFARSAIISYRGVCDLSWDTHADHITQQENNEEFFGFLSQIMSNLESSTNIEGAPLIDDVVVVVISEMGRSPAFNTYGGRDHWTYTSAMLLGSGIKGNQSLGGLDNNALGLPISLETGEITTNGTHILPQHLGATLLAMGDIDFSRYVTSDTSPIWAALS